MKILTQRSRVEISEIKDFFVHLRLGYNFLILSAPFLLGALYLPEISNVNQFIFLFLLVYIFLFGGANAYNSYFDNDNGPIGGLEYPPEMRRWMHYASWAIQLIGLALSFLAGIRYFSLFFLSIVLFWMYSGPFFRLKSRALASFVVIGAGTAFNAALMGYVAAGGNEFTSEVLFGALGVTMLILSMYPFSQVYQIDEDTRRGDTTFAVKYGTLGVKLNFLILFLLAIALLSFSFASHPLLSKIALAIGTIAYALIWSVIKTITGRKEEYKKIMRTKYIGGISFTLSVLFVLVFL